MTRDLSLAKHLFFSQLKRGSFNLILAALGLATLTVMIIALAASAIDATLKERSTHLLAADVQITGSSTVPPEWRQHAESLGISTASALSFRAMVFSGDNSQIFKVKAVDLHYPLKGKVDLAQQSVQHGPPKGTVFAPQSLLFNLNLTLKDTISIGRSELVIDAELLREPDNLRGNFGFAPTLLMHIDDVAATGVLQPGSRYQTTLYLAGKKQQLDDLQKWLEPQLGEHFEWRSVDQANRGVSNALDRAKQFFLLGICLSVLLSGTAIGLGARKYALDQLAPTALLKSLGLGPKATRRIYLAQLHGLAVFGIVPAMILGWFSYQGLRLAIYQVIPDLQAAPTAAYLLAAFSVYLTLLAFAAPYFLRVPAVSPASVLRPKSSGDLLNTTSALACGFVTLALVCIVFTRQPLLVLYLSLVLSICFALTAALAWLMSAVLRKLARDKPVWLRIGFDNLVHHKQQNVPQMAMFAVLFTLVCTIVLARTSLIEQWQQQLPTDAPNYFMFNLFDDEKPDLEDFLEDHNITINPIYPMARSRMTHVNDLTVDELLKQSEHTINYTREFNITWTDQLGSDNKIVEGEFWNTAYPDSKQASLEQAFAEGLNIRLGDHITLSEQGEKIEAVVTSIREVQWDSLNPNFFIILNHALRSESSTNWLTSFNVPDEHRTAFFSWLKQHPTVTAIEIEQTLQLIKEIIAQVSLAIELIGVLVVLAGLLVFIASLQMTLDLRTRENAILRVFGADKKRVRLIMLTEALSIATISCLIACISSELCMYLLGKKLFELPLTWHPLLWLLTPCIILPGIAFTSVFSTRRTLTQSPLNTLRSLD